MDHLMGPSALGFIKDGHFFRGDILIADKGIAVFVNDLDKGRCTAQGIGFGNAMAALLFLRYFITGQCFLEYSDQGIIAG